MDNGFGSALDEALENYDAHAKRQEDHKIEQQSSRSAFTEKFRTLRSDVIKPIFDEVTRHIAKHGHTTMITERNEAADVVRGFGEVLGIKMDVFIKGIKRSEFTPTNTPNLSINIDPLGETILLHGSTTGPKSGGTAGSKGILKMDDASEERIREFVSAMLVEIFKNAAPPQHQSSRIRGSGPTSTHM